MPCIIGIEHKNSVIMCCDVFYKSTMNKNVVHTPIRIFSKPQSNYIIGFSGNLRFGQILEHEVNYYDNGPEDSLNIEKWIITYFIKEAELAVKANNYCLSKDDKLLIGVKNQLWEVDNNFGISRCIHGYSAIGDGTDLSIGSIYTSLTEKKERNYNDIEKILETAIRCNATFTSNVGYDSIIISN